MLRMSQAKTTQVALLRGINVAGKKKVPMAQLRALAGELGFEGARTYIQSGNLVYRSPHALEGSQKILEKAIAERFGFDVEVTVRDAARWLGYAKGSPFPDAEALRPKTLLMAISKSGPMRDALDIVMSYATNERASTKGDALWIDFVDGSGRSKVTPASLQKALGPSATTRNWHTVLAIADLVRELEVE